MPPVTSTSANAAQGTDEPATDTRPLWVDDPDITPPAAAPKRRLFGRRQSPPDANNPT
jgi:hypothetical protein